jgi:hypothetical protein
MSQIFMQNDSSNFTLSTLVNKFLNASYIRLVIFLSISFKFFFVFFIFSKNCIFPKYHIFQLLEKKKKDVERELVEENFGKRDRMGERNNKKMKWLIQNSCSPHVAFFLAHLIKYLFYFFFFFFFFGFFNANGIL